MKDFYDRYELPTVVLGLVLYASWVALVWWHASIPGWLLFIAGGYVTQWHFSLQHESIHGMRNWPAWLRTAFVWPPLGLWMPYPVYNRSHSTHHVNFNITHPQRDTESNYHLRDAWPGYNAPYRFLLMLNQTLLVRMAVGPFLRLYKLAKKEIGRVRGGDYSNAGHWVTHAISLAVLLYFVTQVAGMPFWKYLLCFAYPGMALGMLRTFIEHRYADRPLARVAIVESNTVMGVLYLYNNLHLVHHRSPTLPWYRIPARFRAEREELLAFNDNFYFRGYTDILRRFTFSPVFDPIHPKW
ncbi:MAG: fatty acid desaturase [Ramlibacter sp.]|nr:fatty acid desaturase [Ramlibacter sp.]